jgi:hypothetical protein
MCRAAVLVLLLHLNSAPAAGVIDTVAGTGEAGYSGNGGPATAARLNQPFHCELDGKGGLLIAEAFNHCIRKVDLKTGVITTVAGCGKKGYTGDGGPATQATMNEPYAVACDRATGDLYVVDRLNAVIRKVDGKTGTMSTVAGTGKPGYSGDGGPAPKAQLREPNDCCLDGKGGLLIADVADWRVRRLDLKTGLITTFAGVGRKTDYKTDDLRENGPAAEAVLVGPRAVCVDGRGTTYICLREGHAVRRVSDGRIGTVAGTGKPGYADGQAPGTATFRGPKAIRCGRAGLVYVVDTENHAIRVFSPDARVVFVRTVAGGRQGSDGDGRDATKAGLDRPHGVAIDDDGTLYIADSNNHRVRRVRYR